jgi:hypothetical protein
MNVACALLNIIFRNIYHNFGVVTANNKTFEEYRLLRYNAV